MSDVHSPETRSYNMSHIRSKNTKPELLVRKYLFSRGLRYRKNDKRYPGKPDMVFPKYKTAVFVNGCFWHMHEGCPCFKMPQTRPEFWASKLSRNHERDLQNYEKLRILGWHVIVLWECELNIKTRDTRLVALYDAITAQNHAIP